MRGKGAGSYVLAGAATSESYAFASACHGAGRAMSRHAASKTWQGRDVVNELAGHGILIRSPSTRGVAEEAPGACKDVTAVVDAAQAAGLAHKVARLKPLICIKGQGLCWHMPAWCQEATWHAQCRGLDETVSVESDEQIISLDRMCLSCIANQVIP